MINAAWLIPALPLAGFFIILVAGRRLGEPKAGYLATTMCGLAFLASVGVFIDNKNDEVVVSDVRTHSASVFRRTADGDIAPLLVIRSAPVGVDAPALGRVTGIAYDSKRDQILAPN